jgi:hypothetical protein
MRSAAVSAIEFFGRRAVNIRIGGRYVLASRRDLQGNRREFACRTARISPFQMLIAAPVLGPIGERVISYFGEFGKLDGWITQVVQGGFLIDITATKKGREKLAGKLCWLEKQQKDASLLDARQQKRLIPENPHSTLILANGSMTSCFVIDMSPSGVAVSADIELEIGTRLAVGRGVGRVVRRFNEGFAVQFDKLQDVKLLEWVVSPASSAVINPLSIAPIASAPVSDGIEPHSQINSSAGSARATGETVPSPEEPVWYVN